MRVGALIVVLVGACHAEVSNYGIFEPDADTGDARARLSGQLVPDAGTPAVDASPGADAGSASLQNACGVAQAQGDIGTVSAAGHVLAQSSASTAKIYTSTAATPATSSTASPDWVHVELWDDYGAFSNGTVHTGTFTISGLETSYLTCGVCVMMLADDATGELTSASHVLMATAGTVTVSSLGTSAGAPLQIDIQGASFEEIDPATYNAITSRTCTSPLDHAYLDGTIAP